MVPKKHNDAQQLLSNKSARFDVECKNILDIGSKSNDVKEYEYRCLLIDDENSTNS